MGAWIAPPPMYVIQHRMRNAAYGGHQQQDPPAVRAFVLDRVETIRHFEWCCIGHAAEWYAGEA